MRHTSPSAAQAAWSDVQKNASVDSDLASNSAGGESCPDRGEHLSACRPREVQRCEPKERVRMIRHADANLC